MVSYSSSTCCCITRTAAKGRLLTIDNLRKREIVNADWCCMSKYEESVDHLFLHCQVYQDLWSLILFFFGLSWVMPRSVVDYWHVGEGILGRMLTMQQHGGQFLCVWHGVFIGRGMHTRFEREEHSIFQLKYLFLQSLYKWERTACPSTSEHLFLDFLDKLNLNWFCSLFGSLFGYFSYARVAPLFVLFNASIYLYIYIYMYD